MLHGRHSQLNGHAINDHIIWGALYTEGFSQNWLGQRRRRRRLENLNKCVPSKIHRDWWSSKGWLGEDRMSGTKDKIHQQDLTKQDHCIQAHLMQVWSRLKTCAFYIIQTTQSALKLTSKVKDLRQISNVHKSHRADMYVFAPLFRYNHFRIQKLKSGCIPNPQQFLKESKTNT